MPDLNHMAWTAIRRCHIYIPPGQPRPILCPDCGATLFEIVEFASGGVRKSCKRCRDAVGRRPLWLFILHKDPRSYMDAVKQEKTLIMPQIGSE